MLIPPRVMQELVCAIAKAASLPELNAIVTTLPQKGGLQHVVYHYLGGSFHGEPAVPGFTSYPEEWVNQYLANDYAQIDPVVQRGLRSMLPFEWSELTLERPEQQEIFIHAKKFDLGAAGLSIPICGLDGERALFSVTSDKPDTFNGPMRVCYIKDYQLLAVYVHESFMRLNGLLPVERLVLSHREKECLALAAKSLLGKEIAHQLKMSEPAVRLYLRVARHKLGAASVSGAVAVAKLRGFIVGYFLFLSAVG